MKTYPGGDSVTPVDTPTVSWLAPALASLLVLLTGASCDPSLSVDRSLQVNDLSEDEIAEYCQWQLDALGGAGRRDSCGGDTYMILLPQQDCEQDLRDARTCDLTVGELERCVLVANEHDMCFIGLAPECENIFYCLEWIPGTIQEGGVIASF